MSNDYIYDLETYPNVFTMAVEHADYPLTWAFEISPWRNDSRAIIDFVMWLKSQGARMIGFNSLGFDYPILHMLMKMGNSDAKTLYDKAMAIIGAQDDDNGDKWAHTVNPSDREVTQIDLYKIRHFDNKSRRTGLKSLEFNMRLDSIQDLPYKVGSSLNQDQLPLLKSYNAHDVRATKEFYFKTLDMIKFRAELTYKYQRDFMNHNDTKIGKDYFIMKLEEAGVPCYEFGPMGRTPRQTKRPQIVLRDAILSWIEFESPEFTRVLNWFKEQTITETKGAIEDVIARVGGFDFVFGLGGIHGSAGGPDTVVIRGNTCYSNGSDTGTDHGIYVADVSNITIDHNTCYSNAGGGIKWTDPCTNVLVYDNYCYSNNTGIYALGTQAIVYNNILYSNACGIYLNNTCQNTNFYNNTLVDNSTWGMQFEDSKTPSGCIFKSNIIYQSFARVGDGHHPVRMSSTGLAVIAANVFDNNLYYYPGAGSSYIFNMQTGANKSFAGWQALTGSPDPHSLNSDPLFVTNFTNTHLQASSPCKGAGATGLGIIYDYDGNLRPSPPAMGAYDLPSTVKVAIMEFESILRQA